MDCSFIHKGYLAEKVLFLRFLLLQVRLITMTANFYHLIKDCGLLIQPEKPVGYSLFPLTTLKPFLQPELKTCPSGDTKGDYYTDIISF